LAIGESLRSIAKGPKPMLDNPEKTARLLDALKGAAPFEVELMPLVVKQLQADKVAAANQPRQIVSDLSYLGDEGGIVCHIAPPESDGAIIISLTHVRVPRSMPLATAVLAYQKHRVKKLKKQRYV
jgi:hypothetical protein